MKAITHRLNRNLGLKLISLVIACLIWMIVSNYNDPVVTRAIKNVPITFKNQDTLTNANKSYTVTDGIEKVNIYVTARKSVTNKLNGNSFTVRADLQNYNEALGSIPLEVTCSDNHVSQEDMRILPSSLRITMEDKVEESFGIGIVTSGKAQKGYEVGAATILTGDTVKIAGPASVMRIIGKVTVDVDISDMDEDEERSYPIRIEDKNGDALSESQLKKLEIKDTDGAVLPDNMATVFVELWKVYPDIKISLNIVGEPAKNYKISSVSLTPKTVSLVGQEEAIEKLGEELLLVNDIDVEGIDKSKEYTLDLNDTLAQHDDIRLEEGTTSTIVAEIGISQLGSRTIEFPVSRITVENIPEDKKLIFTPADNVSVNVKATDADLDELHLDNIKGSMDLKNCKVSGSYTVPVEITLPYGYELAEDVTIVVNIEDAEGETEVEANSEE